MKAPFYALFALLSTSAVAGTTDIFSEIDKDSDGYISSEEAQTMPSLTEVFQPADQDKDGKLNISEFLDATGTETEAE